MRPAPAEHLCDLAAVCASIKKTKIHIIHGDQDPTIPVADAHEFHKRLPGSTLDIIAGGSHSFRTAEEGQDRMLASVAEQLAALQQ